MLQSVKRKFHISGNDIQKTNKSDNDLAVFWFARCRVAPLKTRKSCCSGQINQVGPGQSRPHLDLRSPMEDGGKRNR